MDFRSPKAYKTADKKHKKNDSYQGYNPECAKTPKQFNRVFTKSFNFKNDNDVRRFSDIHKDDS
jgi:hypothetical protein